jgi:hypothetical protein
MLLPPLLPTYGIDSFARAIAFSALILRNSYLSSDDRNISDSVQLAITTTNNQTLLAIRCTLAYNPSLLLNNANLLSGIEERVIGTVIWNGTATPSVYPDVFFLIPSVVNTVERLFYYSAQQYLLNDMTKLRLVNIAPVFKGGNTLLECVVSIPINYSVYLAYNNLIEAIDIAPPVPPVPPVPPTVTGFGDSTQLTDNLQLR